MLPSPAVPNDAFGAAKLGMFVTLKISALGCSRAAPVNGMFLNTDRSIRRCGGPCSVLFPVLPAVLIGCAAKAATLSHPLVVVDAVDQLVVLVVERSVDRHGRHVLSFLNGRDRQ